MKPVRAGARAAAVVLLALAAGCSGSGGDAAFSGPPPPRSDLSDAKLAELLLEPADLPGLTGRRQFASAELTTQGTPQLALCRPPVPDAPHAIANVLSGSGQDRQVRVFQVLSAYADDAGARAAYDRAVAQARSCRSYEVDGRPYAVEDLAEVEVPRGAAAAQYRLTTPSVVSGDVRTLARSGRFLVLVSGFGEPPGGQDILEYQADVVRKALSRLPA